MRYAGSLSLFVGVALELLWLRSSQSAAPLVVKLKVIDYISKKFERKF